MPIGYAAGERSCPMKQIIAVVKPYLVEEVLEALEARAG